LLVSNSSGAFTDGIAEFVLMRMLMFSRHAEALYDAQKRREWPRDSLAGTTLRGKRLVVIGNGSIGSEVARLAEALGMQVRLCGRKDGPDLPGIVADARYVVIAASLTASSRGILSRSLIAAMQARPYIINVSRGALIETAALLEAVRDGRLSGAALDVFDQEPLPPESPLYSTPGISISPHISGVFDEVKDNAARVFARNLECFLEGRPLPNRILLQV
ncbi:MAG: D-2-hydroxyacid dehydrogenase, partial [Acidobacteria bacterium]|nr:D-2-hydroxyacid dehydrogenase [Acidobacteriota bacterium]